MRQCDFHIHLQMAVGLDMQFKTPANTPNGTIPRAMLQQAKRLATDIRWFGFAGVRTGKAKTNRRAAGEKS
jgi:hypothetical protein